MLHLWLLIAFGLATPPSGARADDWPPSQGISPQVSDQEYVKQIATGLLNVAAFLVGVYPDRQIYIRKGQFANDLFYEVLKNLATARAKNMQIIQLVLPSDARGVEAVTRLEDKLELSRQGLSLDSQGGSKKFVIVETGENLRSVATLLVEQGGFGASSTEFMENIYAFKSRVASFKLGQTDEVDNSTRSFYSAFDDAEGRHLNPYEHFEIFFQRFSGQGIRLLITKIALLRKIVWSQQYRDEFARQVEIYRSWVNALNQSVRTGKWESLNEVLGKYLSDSLVQGRSVHSSRNAVYDFLQSAKSNFDLNRLAKDQIGVLMDQLGLGDIPGDFYSPTAIDEIEFELRNGNPEYQARVEGVIASWKKYLVRHQDKIRKVLGESRSLAMISQMDSLPVSFEERAQACFDVTEKLSRELLLVPRMDDDWAEAVLSQVELFEEPLLRDVHLENTLSTLFEERGARILRTESLFKPFFKIFQRFISEMTDETANRFILGARHLFSADPSDRSTPLLARDRIGALLNASIDRLLEVENEKIRQETLQLYFQEVFQGSDLPRIWQAVRGKVILRLDADAFCDDSLNPRSPIPMGENHAWPFFLHKIYGTD